MTPSPAPARPPREELTELLQRGYRYALSLTHEQAGAEDLVQEAWTALLGRGGPFHAGYLFATIRHRHVDRVRRLRLVDMEPLDDGGADDAADPGGESLIVDRAIVRQALSRLRAEEREALYLFAVEGYGLAEIGRLTGRPEGTVSSLVTRARQRMRRALGAGAVRMAR